MKLSFRLMAFLILYASGVNAQASFSLSPNKCLNDSAIVIANTGSLSNCTYTWFCIDMAVSTVTICYTPTISMTFSNVGTYFISLKVQSGQIIDSTYHLVNVGAPSTISLTASEFTTCIVNNFPSYSKLVHLVASGGVSYTWNPAPSPSMNGGNPNGPLNDVSPLSNNCFSLIGENQYGCRDTTSVCISILPQFSISASPTNTSICFSNNPGGDSQIVQLSAGNPSGSYSGTYASLSYTWSGPNLLTSANSPTVLALPYSSTTYTAEVRDSLGCVSLPAYSTVNVLVCTGNREDEIEKMQLYPNPAKDFVVLEVGSRVANVSVVSSTGGVMFTTEFTGKTRIETYDLPGGVYFVIVVSGDLKRVIKLVKL